MMNSLPSVSTGVVIAVLCAINWIAAYKQQMKLYYITKPMVLIAMMVFFALNGGFAEKRIAFFVGLALSLLGDIFLISRRTRFFVSGMVAFALAHMAYIYGFLQWPVPVWSYGIAVLALVICVLAFSLYMDLKCKESSLRCVLKRLFKVYSFLVSAMAVIAWLGFFREDWQLLPTLLAGIGASLFVLSDLMIALGKLEKQIPHQRFWVIVTYHVAQMLILTSIVMIKG